MKVGYGLKAPKIGGVGYGKKCLGAGSYGSKIGYSNSSSNKKYGVGMNKSYGVKPLDGKAAKQHGWISKLYGSFLHKLGYMSNHYKGDQNSKSESSGLDNMVDDSIKSQGLADKYIPKPCPRCGQDKRICRCRKY